MKKIQREALEMAYDALGIPFPASGTQTTTIRGLAEFAADCRRILPKVRRLLLLVGTGEMYPGELRSEIDSLDKETSE